MGQQSARNMFSVEFKLPATFRKKAKWVVACCPPLDVCSQGETENKARAALVEALKAFIISCLERDTLDAVMKECGISVKREARKPAKSVAPSKTVKVPIPFELLNARQHQDSRRGCPV
mgnify:CR=1 FL=1